MSTHDFRAWLPTPETPRVKGMLGKNAHEHGAAGLSNPIPRDLLFAPWERLYGEPFVGITSDGQVHPDLFRLAPDGAPVEAMIAATDTLLRQLSADERAALVYPVDAREWRRWNNTEMYAWQVGLRLDEMRLPVREAILAVVAASLSDSGYEKTRNVMRLNHFLGELVGNTRVLGEYSYNFALFGLPSAQAPWGWQLSGHHLALNCVIVAGQMTLTPAFMGAEPTLIDTGPHAGTRLFQDEENRGLALMRALTPGQRREATVYEHNVGGDLPAGRRHRADQLHLGGAFQDNRVVPWEGIAAAALDSDQRRHLMRLVEAFVAPLPTGPQAARLDEIERHLDVTRFGWIGGTGENDTFYYRIQSPVVMIEFDHHSGVYLTNPHPARFHIHTIVRTPNGGDYGLDLLRQHYRAEHHHAARPGIATEHHEHRAGGAGDGHTHGHDHAHGHAHGHAHNDHHDHGHSHSHSHDHDHDHDHHHADGHSHSHGQDR